MMLSDNTITKLQDKQILDISQISDSAGAVQQDINITVSYE